MDLFATAPEFAPAVHNNSAQALRSLLAAGHGPGVTADIAIRLSSSSALLSVSVLLLSSACHCGPGGEGCDARELSLVCCRSATVARRADSSFGAADISGLGGAVQATGDASDGWKVVESESRWPERRSM